MVLIDVTGKLVIDKRTREWCKLPYPDHPKGCPNFGKRSTCPPQAPFVEEWIDLKLSHWFVVTEFNLSKFAKEMRRKHPEWSDKRCRCCLYWQNSVRKELRKQCNKFLENHPDAIFTLLPEAMGVDVFKTVRKFNIPIIPRPDKKLFKVALIGYPKKVCSKGNNNFY